MKQLKIMVIGACLLIGVIVVAAIVNSQTASAEKKSQMMEGNGFAVLELFTSEGCSSCPPADKLLADIRQEAQGRPVYVLAYHVDYWDHQGWKDAFSSPAYSKRQLAYSEWLNVQQVYTPQLVVNGKYEYIGSDERVVRRAIKAVLSAAPAATVALQGQLQGNKLLLDYQVSGGSRSDLLQLALVQKAAVSNVKRGENTGRTLSHVQIVRELHTIDLPRDKKGQHSISLPKGFDPQSWEVIGFVQNNNNGEILGATKAQLQ